MENVVLYSAAGLALAAFLIAIVSRFNPTVAADVRAVENRVKAVEPAVLLKLAAEAKTAAEEAVSRAEADAVALAAAAVKARAAYAALFPSTPAAAPAPAPAAPAPAAAA